LEKDDSNNVNQGMSNQLEDNSGLQGTRQVDPYKDDLEKAINETGGGMEDDAELQRAIQESLG